MKSIVKSNVFILEQEQCKILFFKFIIFINLSESLIQSMEDKRRVKLVIVGDGGVGKSSLCQ